MWKDAEVTAGNVETSWRFSIFSLGSIRTPRKRSNISCGRVIISDAPRFYQAYLPSQFVPSRLDCLHGPLDEHTVSRMSLAQFFDVV